MPVEIKNRFTQEVILVVEAESLGRVDLSGLNLEGADLSGLNLIRANLRDRKSTRLNSSH